MSKEMSEFERAIFGFAAATGLLPGNGIHKHRCAHGHEAIIWEHEDACSMAPPEEFDKAHQCPKCKSEVTAKYHGPEDGEFRHCVGSAGGWRVPALRRKRQSYEFTHQGGFK